MSSINIEMFIIKELFSNIIFCSKYIDKLEHDFFNDEGSSIFKCIKKYYGMYFKIPSRNVVIKTLLPKLLKNDSEKIEKCEDYFNECLSLEYTEEDLQFIEDEVKNFIKIRKIKKALLKSVEYLEKGDADSAASIVMKASEVSFDDDLGIDYFGDLHKRIEDMKKSDYIIPSGHKIIDEAIGGGWRPKSLIVFAAPTNGGKTLILGHVSYKLIEQGLNGLYITLEINQNILASRIDVNLSNISTSEYIFKLDEVQKIIEEKVKERQEKAKIDSSIKPFGTLIIKESFPNVFNANSLISLLKSLQLKKSFKPDFICIDYLGLMIPNGKAFSESTYGKLKTVTEEVRQVAMMYNIPIFSAVQVNREGYNSTDIGLEKIADSMGVAHGADLIIMVSKSSDEDERNKMYWKIAKSRWSKNDKIIEVSVDYNHMRIVTEEEIKQESQQLVSDFIEEFKKKLDESIE
ncbi:MAG: hypothetical protein NZZ41_01225 [Candidatus Dojkabacteria bacterium]|nr:hypothetical protein [Candidatus Dojkabacteria bacterium]